METGTQVDQLGRNLDEINRLLGNRQTQAVTINGSAISLCVSIIAVFAIVVSVAAVCVVWAWRENDVRDMAQIRARLMQLEQYRERDNRRLDKIEAANDTDSP